MCHESDFKECKLNKFIVKVWIIYWCQWIIEWIRIISSWLTRYKYVTTRWWRNDLFTCLKLLCGTSARSYKLYTPGTLTCLVQNVMNDIICLDDPDKRGLTVTVAVSNSETETKSQATSTSLSRAWHVMERGIDTSLLLELESLLFQVGVRIQISGQDQLVNNTCASRTSNSTAKKSKESSYVNWCSKLVLLISVLLPSNWTCSIKTNHISLTLSRISSNYILPN